MTRFLLTEIIARKPVELARSDLIAVKEIAPGNPGQDGGCDRPILVRVITWSTFSIIIVDKIPTDNPWKSRQ
jgi:hypothetical protein